VIAPEHS
jgi:polyisoprenoid-binding protein YceI